MPALCLCQHVAFSLCSASESSSAYKDTIIGFRAALVKYDLILTSFYLQRPYFQIRSHSQVSFGQESGGTLFNQYRDHK